MVRFYERRDSGSGLSACRTGSSSITKYYDCSSIVLFLKMWIFNWFKSTLESLGLVNKKAKIVFLGLDDAGKTTLLLRLKEDVMKQMDPTQQPYSEELSMGKITFKAWDLGGHEAARKTWRNYVSDVDGIIYLVDSANNRRFEESRIELEGILEMPELEKVPIVILGNKIDKAGAVPENELREALGV